VGAQRGGSSTSSRLGMEGWQVTAFGDPREVLRYESLKRPSPGPGQVLIEVIIAPVNFAEHLVVRGQYQERPTLPLTPGLEVLGRVVEKGAGVDIPEGTRVLAYAELPSGGFAQFALAEAKFAFVVPGGIPDLEASCLLISYQTAWIALHRRAKLCPGELVVVHAGAGAAGSAAIQLALAAGARVIATAGSNEKVNLCRSLGAEIALNYKEADIVGIVREASEGRGADVIFDPVGGSLFETSLRCVAWEGRILVIGFASGSVPSMTTNHALLKNYSVVGVYAGRYRSVEPSVVCTAQAEIFRLYQEGGIAPLIGDEMGMTELPDALENVAAGKTIGKVLLHSVTS
jgi:NADPH2:quinone reductase